VVVDDLQWADADSLALLEAVTRPPEAPAMLLLATVRANDARSTGELDVISAERDRTGEFTPTDASADSRALELLAHSRLLADTRVVNLPRLSPDEARELAASLLTEQGASSSTAAEAGAVIAEEAGGHPLFIDELVRHAAAVPERGGPLHLDDALRERVRRLDPQAQRLLHFITVAGLPVPQSAAARAADLDVATFSHHVATLRAANLVRTTGARPSDLIEPYHDRVRAAVQAGRSPAEIRRAHERIALGLESTGRADPEALASHWQGAGDNDKAAAYAAQAAERATKALAFERAAQLYRQTLLLRAPGSPDAPALQVKLGDALAQTGRGAEAARAYLAAAERSTPADALELRRRASEQLLRSGHVDDGMAALQPVLAAVKLHLPATARRALTGMLWRRAQVRLRGLDFKRRLASSIPPQRLARADAAWSIAVGLGNVDTLLASSFAAHHVLLALEAGEPTRVARALALDACLSAMQGKKGAARVARFTEAARRLADELGDPHARALSVAATAIAVHMQGRWRACLAGFDEAERMFREQCTGVAWELSTGNLMRAYSLARLGELSELAKNVTASLQDAEQRGDLYGSTVLRMGEPNLIWLVQDLPDEARGECEDAIGRWSQRAFHTQHSYHVHAMVQIELYAGQGEAAWQRVLAMWPRLLPSFLLRLPLPRLAMIDLRARAAVAAAAQATGARRKELLAEARRAARAVSRVDIGSAGAAAAAIRAGVAHLSGDDAGAATLLAEAAALFDREEMAMHAACARGVRGRLVGGDEGAAQLAAMDTFMRRQHIAAPDRFSRIFIPGF
jgi:tetratricopeptide (TPR) repeat protein